MSYVTHKEHPAVAVLLAESASKGMERCSDAASGISRIRLGFPEPPGRVLVQQARDQRLIRKPLLERAFLDGFKILRRNANVQPAILSKRRLGVATIAVSFPLDATGGPPLATPDRFEDRLFVRVKFHNRRAPSPSTAVSP